MLLYRSRKPFPAFPMFGLLMAALASATLAVEIPAAAEKAHTEIWKRFVDEHGIVLDYTELDGSYPRPSPEECVQGKPNALAWWTATENGGMFNGTYMEAAILRWQITGKEEDREKVRKLAQGLLLLSSVGKTPGFIARNVATDGRTPYPMGSNDQTSPWFYGLWRYLGSEIPSAEEAAAVKARLIEVALAIEQSQWMMPCNEGAPSPTRGSFAGVGWEHAPRLLFVMKLMHELTDDAAWQQKYLAALEERNPKTQKNRLDVCRDGMLFEHEKRHSWTCASGVICLRALWEMEKDPQLKKAYHDGLVAGARLAATSLFLHKDFDPQALQKFQGDWRVLNQWWKPQHSEQDALDVAMAQVRELGKMSPRRHREFTFVREPAYAAWLITFCPDTDLVRSLQSEIMAVVNHYDYSKLYYSQFFPVEAACYRLALIQSE